MKKRITIAFVLSLIINLFLLYQFFKINPNDVNKDGIVNSKDLLDLKIYLIKEIEKNG